MMLCSGIGSAPGLSGPRSHASVQTERNCRAGFPVRPLERTASRDEAAIIFSRKISDVSDSTVASFPLAASGAAAIVGAREGFARLVADAGTDRVVGVHVVGPRATELAATGALAIEMMVSPTDLAATLHPHPTFSEGLHEAAEMLLGTPIHVPVGAANLAGEDRSTRRP